MGVLTLATHDCSVLGVGGSHIMERKWERWKLGGSGGPWWEGIDCYEFQHVTLRVVGEGKERMSEQFTFDRIQLCLHIQQGHVLLEF